MRSLLCNKGRRCLSSLIKDDWPAQTKKVANQVQYVKQFGMQRSGTNIVKALLEENFDVRVLNLILGNKHLPFDAAAAGSWSPSEDVKEKIGLAEGELERIRDAFRIGSIGCTLIIKEPFAWLRSLYRYRQSKKKDLLSLTMSSSPPI